MLIGLDPQVPFLGLKLNFSNGMHSVTNLAVICFPDYYRLPRSHVPIISITNLLPHKVRYVQ